MKFLVFSVALCTLVATATAQTKSPKITSMQQALGDMLSLVKDLAIANRELISDINVQVAMKSANASLAELKSLYAAFGTTNTSAVPLALRSRVNTAFNNFKTAIADWEATLKEFPLSPVNMSMKFTTIEKTFLSLGAAVVPL